MTELHRLAALTAKLEYFVLRASIMPLRLLSKQESESDDDTTVALASTAFILFGFFLAGKMSCQQMVFGLLCTVSRSCFAKTEENLSISSHSCRQ